MNFSFWIVLLVVFIDTLGIGLVYPLFAAMLFDSGLPLLPENISHNSRGVYLGFLIALMPLAQFFTAPIWGAYSDFQGRKKPLFMSLVIMIVSYVLALLGTWMSSIVLLFIFRIVLGLGSGNISVVQAAVADLSSTENKAKNFGLYGMAMGAGYTFGPFIGGVLSKWGYTTPFIFSLILVLLNTLLVFFYFRETHTVWVKRKLSWKLGFSQLQSAFKLKELRIILAASFIFNFGWSYFIEFIPIYLISHFHFSALELGYFYGIDGGIYAISTGILIRPFLGRFPSVLLFCGGMFLTAIMLLLMPIYSSLLWLGIVILFLFYFAGHLLRLRFFQSPSKKQ